MTTDAVRDALGTAHPLARHIGDFLTDLTNAGKSEHTVRAYRGDLIGFAAHHDDEVGELTAAPIRAYLSEIAGLAASSRKRKRAAVASFCRWAVRHELLDANPMDRIDTITVPKTLPRPADPDEVKKVFGVICTRRPRKDVPLDRLRDRVLFETAYICGTPRLRSLRHQRRRPRPAPGRRTHPPARQRRHRPHRPARRLRLRRPA